MGRLIQFRRFLKITKIQSCKKYKLKKSFENKFHTLVNICNLYLSILLNSTSRRLTKSQKILSISELIDFMKKENFIKKLKEKDDKDSTIYIELLESSIKKIPDLGISFLILIKRKIKEISNFHARIIRKQHPYRNDNLSKRYKPKRDRGIQEN